MRQTGGQAGSQAVRRESSTQKEGEQEEDEEELHKSYWQAKCCQVTERAEEDEI